MRKGANGLYDVIIMTLLVNFMILCIFIGFTGDI